MTSGELKKSEGPYLLIMVRYREGLLCLWDLELVISKRILEFQVKVSMKKNKENKSYVTFILFLLSYAFQSMMWEWHEVKRPVMNPENVCHQSANTPPPPMTRCMDAPVTNLLHLFVTTRVFFLRCLSHPQLFKAVSSFK